MVNWESELKRYIAKKFKEMMGEEIPLENIHTIEVEMNLNLSGLTISELGNIYAFAIMKEDFEHAKKLAAYLNKKGFKIKIETDDVKKIGNINIYKKSRAKVKKPEVIIPIKIYPDGMIVDFEKQGDF